MTDEIKGLIEKIKTDGLKVATEKANHMEAQAKKQADQIIKQAKLEAEQLLDQAKSKITRMEEGSQLALKQAGRDLLLALRKEINLLLDKLVNSSIGEALEPKELAKILSKLIEESKAADTEQIVISLKKDDRKKLEDTFFKKLKRSAKEGILLKDSEEISGGFLISYDCGKSHFDFTDSALAEYLGSQLKPRLKSIFE